MPRIHLLGFPHTETTNEYSWCAFTQKTKKLATMLDSVGWDVRLYGGENNEAHVTENIPIVTHADQAAWFSQRDWKLETFDQWDANMPCWQAMNQRSILAIRERMEPGDILGLTMGYTQQSVAQALPELIPVEVGVGYWGVWAPYRVFESYALRHALSERVPFDDERENDTVIPNFFTAEEFPAGDGKGGYYLMVCRFVRRKGIARAVEATRAIGAKLIIAGNGCIQEGNTFRGIGGESGFVVQGDHIQHVGVVGPNDRAELMGGAIATFTPSIYLEAFCGVHAESLMCGTPVITSDWGAFTETVRDGIDGYRCHTAQEYAEAALSAVSLDRDEIREGGLSRFSTDVVRHQYDHYLRRLIAQREEGSA